MLVPPHLTSQVGSWRPTRVLQEFPKPQLVNMVKRLHKLEALLENHGGDSNHDKLNCFRDILEKRDPQYNPRHELDEMLWDMQSLFSASRIGPASLRQSMPDDAIVQLFPGADHPEMPADVLLQIEDRWNPTRPPSIGPMTTVICRTSSVVQGKATPFSMGVVVAPLENDAREVIIQWWVPPFGAESNSGGRSRTTVDMFGRWAY